MEKFISTLTVMAPIVGAVALGLISRKRNWLTEAENRGLQQYAIRIGLPCVVFNSCLTMELNSGALLSMAMILPILLIGCLWSFRARGGKYPYHNLPLLFSAQETGMMGIPLFITLFGASEAYRMGVLDLTQAIIAYPVLAILTAPAGEDVSAGKMAKNLMNILKSPFLIMSLLGLFLNLCGARALLARIGLLGAVTGTAEFLSRPLTTVMLFSVGFTFSLSPENRSQILRLSLGHFLVFGLYGLAVQGILLLIPSVDSLTRWVMALYFTLPASYLAAGLGKNSREGAIASGVSSITTLLSLISFCVIAGLAA